MSALNLLNECKEDGFTLNKYMEVILFLINTEFFKRH